MSFLGDEPSVLEEGPLIWAVDDDAQILDVLAHVMGEGGYRFEGFSTPGELFERLDEPQGECPNALILDWMLPDISGHEVLCQLKAHARWMEPPVLVLTAMPGESVLLNAFEAGAADLLRKPFSVVELMARLRGRMGQRADYLSMARRKDALNLLLSLSGELGQAGTLEQLASVFASTICKVVNCQRCIFYKQDEARGELAALTGDDLLSVGHIPRVMASLVARASAVLDTRELAALGLRGGQGILLPVWHDDSLLGAFLLTFEGEEQLADERVVGVLKVAVEIATLNIERLLLVESLRRKHHEARVNSKTLARTRDYLASVIEASRDAIVAATQSGEIVLFNGAAEEILKISREQALGQSVRMLYPAGGAEAIMASMRSDQDGPKGRLNMCEACLVDRDGEPIPVNIAGAILYGEGGEEIGTVGVFTDLRQQLLIERRLQRVTEDLERGRERAIMAELAGATAHELNQPLTSLLNYAEWVASQQHTEARMQRAAHIMAREAHAIAEIVRQIGAITQYRTRDYVDGARIVEFDQEEE